jgi:hypothetical protein
MKCFRWMPRGRVTRFRTCDLSRVKGFGGLRCVRKPRSTGVVWSLAQHFERAVR